MAPLQHHWNIRAISVDEEAIEPIGVQHITPEGVGEIKFVIEDVSLSVYAAASALTESMLQQHTELCASASSKKIKFHRNNSAEAKRERLLTRTAYIRAVCRGHDA